MIKRGDVLLVAAQGDFGKVRPAIVVQTTASLEHFASVTVCLVTSRLRENSTVRVDVAPDLLNNLQKPSQIQADKIQTYRLEKIRKTLGRVDAATLQKLDVALAFHLNLYALAKPGDQP